MFISNNEKELIHSNLQNVKQHTTKNARRLENQIKCETCKCLIEKSDAEKRQNLVVQSSCSSTSRTAFEEIKRLSVYWSGLTKRQYKLEDLYFCQKCAPDKGLLKDGSPVVSIKTVEDIKNAPEEDWEELDDYYSCNQCDFTTDSESGLAVHRGRMHK